METTTTNYNSSEKVAAKKDIGAIWVRESKTGNKYLSAVVTINGEKINIVGFKNNYKEEGSSQPDYRLYESEPLTK